MSVGVKRLRGLVLVAAMLITVGLGWMLVVRPVSAERSRVARQLDRLRQREVAVRRSLSEPSPRVVTADSVADFERQVAAEDASPALLEQLARLTQTTRIRNLLIEIVETTAATAGTPAAGSALPDPRFRLFDVPVSFVPIRMAFETDYGSLGRFLWAFRDLPTTVEIRALTVGLPQSEPGGDTITTPDGTLRVSLTLYAYSRRTPALVPASNTAVAR